MSEEKDSLKDQLTPEEYYVTQNHGTEPAFSGSMILINRLEYTAVLYVEQRYLALRRNMTLDRVGQVFINLLLKAMWEPKKIFLLACKEQKCIATTVRLI